MHKELAKTKLANIKHTNAKLAEAKLAKPKLAKSKLPITTKLANHRLGFSLRCHRYLRALQKTVQSRTVPQPVDGVIVNGSSNPNSWFWLKKIFTPI